MGSTGPVDPMPMPVSSTPALLAVSRSMCAMQFDPVGSSDPGRWELPSGKAPCRCHRPCRPRFSFRRYRPRRSWKLASAYSGAASALALPRQSSSAPLVLVRQVRHVHGDGRTVSDLRRRVGTWRGCARSRSSSAMWSCSGCLPRVDVSARTVRLLGPVLQRLVEVMFEGAVAARECGRPSS